MVSQIVLLQAPKVRFGVCGLFLGMDRNRNCISGLQESWFRVCTFFSGLRRTHGILSVAQDFDGEPNRTFRDCKSAIWCTTGCFSIAAAGLGFRAEVLWVFRVWVKRP